VSNVQTSAVVQTSAQVPSADRQLDPAELALSGNAPNDIYGDSTGTGNTISGNTCTKTNLTGAC
jgi:hypothetical protein